MFIFVFKHRLKHENCWTAASCRVSRSGRRGVSRLPFIPDPRLINATGYMTSRIKLQSECRHRASKILSEVGCCMWCSLQSWESLLDTCEYKCQLITNCTTSTSLDYYVKSLRAEDYPILYPVNSVRHFSGWLRFTIWLDCCVHDGYMQKSRH